MAKMCSAPSTSNPLTLSNPVGKLSRIDLSPSVPDRSRTIPRAEVPTTSLRHARRYR